MVARLRDVHFVKQLTYMRRTDTQLMDNPSSFRVIKADKDLGRPIFCDHQKKPMFGQMFLSIINVLHTMGNRLEKTGDGYFSCSPLKNLLRMVQSWRDVRPFLSKGFEM